MWHGQMWEPLGSAPAAFMKDHGHLTKAFQCNRKLNTKVTLNLHFMIYAKMQQTARKCVSKEELLSRIPHEGLEEWLSIEPLPTVVSLYPLISGWKTDSAEGHLPGIYQ